jgi:hypothetical protein
MYLWLNSDSLGMNSSQIGVFEQSYQVSFSSFLQSTDCSALESNQLLKPNQCMVTSNPICSPEQFHELSAEMATFESTIQ